VNARSSAARASSHPLGAPPSRLMVLLGPLSVGAIPAFFRAGAPTCDAYPARSRMISRAALVPGAPVIPPPG
jgi:hypothetical protein